MNRITPLPTSIDGLTPEWLTAALQTSGALASGRVTGVSAGIG